eukprot:TRINITY_DN32124_c0_g1_i1.p1 TRINITY_DN32124_c0_g1~~TRINITY_DN32124_c0_g1_i1.p1  ORF type:complete len:104 (+),score=10.44 TRINITY_DN32124_c0_g1_i1:1-312(+)
MVEWNSIVRKLNKGSGTGDGNGVTEICEFSELHDSCLLLEAENNRLLSQISDNILASLSCCDSSTTKWGALRHRVVCANNRPLLRTSHLFQSTKLGSLGASSA